MRKIAFIITMLCPAVLYASPRYDVNHGNGGAMLVLFVILALIYLIKKK